MLWQKNSVNNMKKFISAAIVSVLIIATFSAVPFSAASGRIVSVSDAASWLRAQENAYYDLDGVYGAQCSDFTTAYMNWLVTGNAKSGTYGVYTAKSYPSVASRDPSKWEVIKNHDGFTPRAGDIFVSVGGMPKYGHTGVIISVKDSETATLIDQNTRWDGAQNAVIYEDMPLTYAYEVTYYIRYKNLTATGQTHSHSYTSAVTKNPTCTENGIRTYTCSCGDSYTEKIAASGHQWDGGTAEKTATCTEDGINVFTCAVCKETKKETVKATGHSVEILAGVLPTCTQNGLTEGKKCTVCGEIITAQTEIPATGHTYRLLSIENKDGKETDTYSCVTCGDSYVETAAVRNGGSQSDETQKSGLSVPVIIAISAAVIIPCGIALFLIVGRKKPK